MKNIKNIIHYIKSYKLNSLFLKTFIIITILLAIPFSIFSVVFRSNLTEGLSNEILNESYATLNRAVDLSDTIITECDSICASLASSEAAQIFALKTDAETLPAEISRFTKSIPLIYRYIDSIYVYSEANSFVFSNGSPVGKDLFRDLSWLDSYNGQIPPNGKIVGRKKNDVYPYLISIIKPIHISNQKVGAIILNIDSSKLYNTIYPLNYDILGEFIIADRDNNILMSSNNDLFLRDAMELDFFKEVTSGNSNNSIKKYNGEDCVFSYAESPDFSFKYLFVRSVSYFDEKINDINRQITIILTIFILLGAVLAYIISAASMSPLNKIMSILNSPGISAENPSENENELKYIINSINKNIEENKAFSETLEEQTKILKNTQYLMLQYQINPHFLYNTLETINWMAYDAIGDENPVSEAIVTLADFFRNSLSVSEYLVPAKSEIEYTKVYAKLINLRYDNAYDIIWDIDSSVLDLTVIKLCLQPIIENALTHGLKNSDNGCIRISAVRNGSVFTIQVKDNGRGIEAEALDSLNKELGSDVMSENHIGLKNVNQRIKIIFGSDYGVRLESEFGKNTSVIITLPAIEWDNDAPKLQQ